MAESEAISNGGVGGPVCVVGLGASAGGSEALRKRNEELRDNLEETVRFNRAAVDRELRMIELKREVNALLTEGGKEPRYVIPDED